MNSTSTTYMRNRIGVNIGNRVYQRQTRHLHAEIETKTQVESRYLLKNTVSVNIDKITSIAYGTLALL